MTFIIGNCWSTRFLWCAKLLLALSPLLVAPAEAAPRSSKATVTELVQPIALYPDVLLQQILPAATFPDQITDAALLIRSKSDAELIKEQSWDNSVKVVATYPGVLKMMYEKLDWTTALGDAFLEDHTKVLDEIQTLREKAKKLGNLKNSEGQKVSTKTDNKSGDTYITIEPSDPQVVYVPQETTTVVYTEPVDNTANIIAPIATFGLGMALGAAMNDDDDDHYYYGGGPMWGSSSYDSWADTRRARNEDINDRIMDRQDFRQDQKSDRQDFRQDWAKDNPGKVNQANVDKARQNAQSKRQNYQANNPQRQQKLADARGSAQSRDFSSSKYSLGSGSTRNSLSGQGGTAFANRASTRGSMSRTQSSFSGGSFSRGGGGFSRGGGGMSRGGGGRGGRR